MILVKTLCGRSCRTPLNWAKLGEKSIFGPEMVIQAEEKVQAIRANLKAAQPR